MRGRADRGAPWVFVGRSARIERPTIPPSGTRQLPSVSAQPPSVIVEYDGMPGHSLCGGAGGAGPLGLTHTEGNTERQVVDSLRTEVCGQQNQSNDPRNNQHKPNTPTTGRRWPTNGTSRHIQHSPGTPTTGLRERGNDTSRSTGQQKAATRRNMRRGERVTVQGPVKKQQPDGMSHGGGLHVSPDCPSMPPPVPQSLRRRSRDLTRIPTRNSRKSTT